MGWGFIRESVMSECDGDTLITEEGPRKQVGDRYLPCIRAEPAVTEVAAAPKSTIVPASKVAGGSDITKVYRPRCLVVIRSQYSPQKHS